MKPHISIITLGVNDLQESTDFYKRIGFPTDTSDGITFIKMPSVWMALYPIDALTADAGIENTKTGFSGFTLAHNVVSKEQVDTIFQDLEKHDVTITDMPHKREWGGYSGYFQDVDGYVWEVAYNPFSPEIAVDESTT